MGRQKKNQNSLMTMPLSDDFGKTFDDVIATVEGRSRSTRTENLILRTSRHVSNTASGVVTIFDTNRETDRRLREQAGFTKRTVQRCVDLQQRGRVGEARRLVEERDRTWVDVRTSSAKAAQVDRETAVRRIEAGRRARRIERLLNARFQTPVGPRIGTL